MKYLLVFVSATCICGSVFVLGITKLTSEFQESSSSHLDERSQVLDKKLQLLNQREARLNLQESRQDIREKAYWKQWLPALEKMKSCERGEKWNF